MTIGRERAPTGPEDPVERAQPGDGGAPRGTRSGAGDLAAPDAGAEGRGAEGRGAEDQGAEYEDEDEDEDEGEADNALSGPAGGGPLRAYGRDGVGAPRHERGRGPIGQASSGVPARSGRRIAHDAFSRAPGRERGAPVLTIRVAVERAEVLTRLVAVEGMEKITRLPDLGDPIPAADALLVEQDDGFLLLSGAGREAQAPRRHERGGGMLPAAALRGIVTTDEHGTRVDVHVLSDRGARSLSRWVGLVVMMTIGPIWIAQGGVAMTDRMVLFGLFALVVTPLVVADVRRVGRERQDLLALVAAVQRGLGPVTLGEGDVAPYRRGLPAKIGALDPDHPESADAAR